MAIICAMELLGTFIGLAVAGIFIGVLSGMLGIGGGTIMVPLLRLVFGLDAYMATATSLFAIIPTSLSGMISHLRAKTCYPKLGLALGLGGAATSSIGVYLGSISPAWAIMVVAAVIILYSAFNMLRKALRLPSDKKEKAARAAAKAGAEVQMHHIEPTSLAEEEFALTGKKIAGGVGIGLVAGLASGYVGVGGGFIMVPLMTSWLGVPMHRASGTSLIAIIILAIPGVIEQIVLGHVDFLAGIMLCAGAIPGAYLGAKLVPKIPERTLRFIFAGFLGVAGIMLALNELGVL